LPLPPNSPLFPYTTLFRSEANGFCQGAIGCGIPNSEPRPLRARSFDDDFKPVAAKLAGLMERYNLAIDLRPVAPDHFAEIKRKRDRKSTRLNSSHRTISYA